MGLGDRKLSTNDRDLMKDRNAEERRKLNIRGCMVSSTISHFHQAQVGSP